MKNNNKQRTNRLALPLRRSALALGVVIALSEGAGQAQLPPNAANITFDGSVGGVAERLQPLPGTTEYRIEQNRGFTNGQNLFHSFTTFDLPSATGTTDVAVFRGTNIRNVVSRVTGVDSPTLINGVIRVESTLPSANFWFVNPSGVVVGSGAQFEVPGAIALGAADFIDLDGAQWSARGTDRPEGSSFSVDPTAFGFLPGAMTGSFEGRSGWNLTNTAGEIRLAGAAGVSLTDARLRTEASPSGDAHGIWLDADSGGISVVNGRLETFTAEQGPAGDIQLMTNGSVVIDQSTLESSTVGTGKAGNITIDANSIRIGNDPDATYGAVGTGGSLWSYSNGSGGGGNISLNAHAGAARLHAAFLSTEGLSGDGGAGNVTIDSGDLRINGTTIQATTLEQGAAGFIHITTTAEADAEIRESVLASSSLANDAGETTGAANEVRLQIGGNLELVNAFIATEGLSTTSGSFAGDAGDVEITAGGTLNVQGSTVHSHVEDGGQAGDITLTAAGVHIGGTRLSASYIRGVNPETQGPGTIAVSANGTRLSQPDVIPIEAVSGVVSIVDSDVLSTNRSGRSKELGRGEVRLSGDNVTIAGSRVSTDVDESGAGEDIIVRGDYGVLITRSLGRASDLSARTLQGAIEPGEIVLDGGQNGVTVIDSSINAQTAQGITPSRPNITVRAAGNNAVISLSGSTIDTSTTGGADAGDITLSANQIVLATSELASNSATSAASGAAGSVLLTGDTVRVTADSRLSTDTGSGRANNRAGNVMITAQESITLERSAIVASTHGRAVGGTISLNGGDVTFAGGTTINSGTTGEGDAGEIAIHGLVISSNLDSDEDEPVQILGVSAGDQSGAAGTISIDGSEVRLANTEISATTESSRAGNLASSILINGDSITIGGNSIVTTSTSNSAAAGHIDIEGGAIRIDNGSTLAATTTGAGDAGDITVAGDVSVTSNLDSAGIPLPSAQRITITSESQTLSSGSAGSVTITGSSIRLANADIRATTESNSGDNEVGNISIGEAGDQIELVDAHVAVTAGDPDLPDLSGGSSGAGDIVLTGSRIALNDGTRLNAQTYAPGDAGNITINGGAVSTNLNSNGTADPTLRRVTLTSRSERSQAGAAGTVTISGGQIRLAYADVSVTTDSDRLNAIGNMVVDGTSVTILGSTLNAETSGATKAGDITIHGASVEINDSDVTASTNATGDAGNIEVSATGADSGAPALRVVGGAAIRSDAVDATSRAADAGYVALRAALGTVSISGETPATPAEVSTAAGTSAGSAGDVEVTASAITLSNAELATTVRATAAPDNLVRGDVALTAGRGIQLTNTLLDARTSGVVDAGSVSIVGDSVEIRGGRQPDSLGSISLPPNTAIVTSTSSDAAAGSIVLQGDAILIEDAFVSSQTSFSGSAGTICIEAGSTQCTSNQVVGAQAGPFPILAAELPDAGGITLEDSTIATSTSGIGAAGSVTLYGTDIVLQGGLIPGGLSPAILTSSTGAGQGGNVTITLAPNGSLLLDDTVIATQSLSTNGGNIQVNAQGGEVVLTDSVILASAGANGRGGNVVIDRHGPTALHRSQIFATAVNNNGGNITLRREGDAVFVSDSQSIVNADSGFGVDGVIDIDSPDTDISAAIQPQDIAVTERPTLAASACEPTQGERSRFVVEGRGGVQIGVDEYQTSSLTPNTTSPTAANSPQRPPLAVPTATLAAVSAEESCR